MRPVYVCQLPDEMQREIRGILTRLLLYQCGTEEKAEKYFDMSLVDAVQLGMDSKIVDIDCVADSFKNGSYIDGEVPENIRKDVERLAEIIRLRTEMETDSPFLYLVRNILNSPQSFIGDVDEIMDGVPVEQEPSDNTLHFLFPRGGKIACCSMKMEEKFFEEYSTHGTSVRGSRADIRQDLAASLEVDETFQEER